MVAGYFCLRLLTSGNYAGLRPVFYLRLPVNYLAGTTPAFCPPLFFAPSLLQNLVVLTLLGRPGFIFSHMV